MFQFAARTVVALCVHAKQQVGSVERLFHVIFSLLYIILLFLSISFSDLLMGRPSLSLVGTHPSNIIPNNISTKSRAVADYSSFICLHFDIPFE